jgi:hypothetical protein
VSRQAGHHLHNLRVLEGTPLELKENVMVCCEAHRNLAVWQRVDFLVDRESVGRGLFHSLACPIPMFCYRLSFHYRLRHSFILQYFRCQDLCRRLTGEQPSALHGPPSAVRHPAPSQSSRTERVPESAASRCAFSGASWALRSCQGSALRS